MNRRDFLKLSIASSLLAGCDILKMRGKIGLALGGGGARGLAHILMLEVLIAIDVSGNRNPRYDKGPSYFETIFNAMQIMQASLMQEKMKNRPPHIYIRPGLENIRVLDFNQVEVIYDQSMPARNGLMRALGYRIQG